MNESLYTWWWLLITSDGITGHQNVPCSDINSHSLPGLIKLYTIRCTFCHWRSVSLTCNANTEVLMCILEHISLFFWLRNMCRVDFSQWFPPFLQVMGMVLEIFAKKNYTKPVLLLRYSNRTLVHSAPWRACFCSTSDRAFIIADSSWAS